MALEGTYEYECMRAELLGIDKPDYEEYIKNKAESEEAQRAALEAETMKEVHTQKEDLQQTSGRLNELGNILKSTQRKINNLTAPFSTFLKAKIGQAGSSKTSSQTDVTELESDQTDSKEHIEKEDYLTEIKLPPPVEKKEKDLTLDHVPLIDEMIEKCDRNAISMQYQIKQMKGFKP